MWTHPHLLAYILVVEIFLLFLLDFLGGFEPSYQNGICNDCHQHDETDSRHNQQGHIGETDANVDFDDALCFFYGYTLSRASSVLRQGLPLNAQNIYFPRL